MAQAMSNPQVAIQQMAQNDPRVKNVLDLVSQSGGDAKTLFYQVAQQRGVDPQPVLDAARQSYNNFMNQLSTK